MCKGRRNEGELVRVCDRAIALWLYSPTFSSFFKLSRFLMLGASRFPMMIWVQSSVQMMTCQRDNKRAKVMSAQKKRNDQHVDAVEESEKKR